MEIKFGQVPDICSGCDCGESFGMFPDETTGDFYYYKVDMYDLETVTLRDTCGRYVPFDLNHLPELIYALQSMQGMVGEAVAQYTEARDYLKENNIATY